MGRIQLVNQTEVFVKKRKFSNMYVLVISFGLGFESRIHRRLVIIIEGGSACYRLITAADYYTYSIRELQNYLGIFSSMSRNHQQQQDECGASEFAML